MITVLPDSGFCGGVNRAVKTAWELADRMPVYLLGNLVNNGSVMRAMAERGFIVAASTEDVPDGGTVVIRAHGVGRDVYDRLRARNAQIIDCTCPKVARVHELVAAMEEQGHRIIIVGKKEHPEVAGTAGWCLGATVISSVEDIPRCDLGERPFAVAQTTFNRGTFYEIVKLIQSACPEAQYADTLCDVTSNRMREAAELAAASDVMIVVGDESSSNSVELAGACRTQCKDTLLVNDWSTLPQIDTQLRIGIVGSTSAPAAIIDDIANRLQAQG